jgi:hypothetical protein
MTLNMAVLMPMPNAKDARVAATNPGLFIKDRAAYRIS